MHSRTGVIAVLLFICAGFAAVVSSHMKTTQAEEREKAECVREYKFLSHYQDTLSSVGDLIALTTASPQSFAIGDGKARDKLDALEREANTMPEHSVLIPLRGQIEAYEHCDQIGLKRCLDDAQDEENEQMKAAQKIIDSTGHCDRFSLTYR